MAGMVLHSSLSDETLQYDPSCWLDFNSVCQWRILSSADNLCKQFGPRSGFKRFDTDSVPERIFEKVNFEKKSQQMTKKA